MKNEERCGGSLVRFGWCVIAGGRGEVWDGVNSRRENSVKEISSGETERMESTVSKRKMRENGKRGEEGTAGIECLRPNMVGGLRLWDERNWSHCFCLSLPSFLLFSSLF